MGLDWAAKYEVKAKPSRAMLYMMGIATVILAMTFLWPMIEPQLLKCDTQPSAGIVKQSA